MTLYLKYRPQKLDELDLADVRDSLTNIVNSGKIPHALLFSGPKGTGKTSAARILAKIVNCLRTNKPCNKCEQCISITKGSSLDVIELDAASHRGIDDVRTLREGVKLAPAGSNKKIYIIDEVHMLTTEASNALLKTLEEPPSHVIFILATTNPEKLLPTIRSRTTEILFKKASNEEIARSLSRVVKEEKIKIDKEGLLAIADTSDGSFRDAVKTLEQLVSEKRSLNSEKIGEYLSQRKLFNVEDFLALLAKRDVKPIISDIERIIEAGGSIESFTETVLVRVRGALLAKVGVGDEHLEIFEKDELVYLIELLSLAVKEMQDSPIEQLPLEIAVIEWCDKGANELKSTQPGSKPVSEIDPASQDVRDLIPGRKSSAEGSSATQDLKQVEASVLGKQPEPRDIKEISEEIWKKILAQIRPINTSIEALLRAAKPDSFDGHTLTLGVFYKFHKERLEEGRNRKILEDVVAGVLGVHARIVCRLTEPPPKEIKKDTEIISSGTVLTEGKDKDIIKIAEEIFGN